MASFDIFLARQVLGTLLLWCLAGKEAHSPACYVALVLGGVWCARGGAGHPAGCQIPIKWLRFLFRGLALVPACDCGATASGSGPHGPLQAIAVGLGIIALSGNE